MAQHANKIYYMENKHVDPANKLFLQSNNLLCKENKFERRTGVLRISVVVFPYILYSYLKFDWNLISLCTRFTSLTVTKKKFLRGIFFHCDVRCYWPCLDPKHLLLNPSNRMFGHMHRVLNKICLQNFLHKWVVNRETNLISLLNP